MTILEIKNLTKSFGGLQILNEVSAIFEMGKITGLVGPNGAGKTTLFNVISGMLRPDHGQVIFQGNVLDHKPPWQRARQGIGRLWQDVRVFEGLTVLENVLVAFKDHPGELVARNFGRISTVRKIEQKNLVQARYWLNFVNLSDKENSLAGSLSWGQQRLLAIARLLANDPQILLLDEPTSGVHTDLIRPILALLRRIAQEGKSLIVIEHNFGLISEVADVLHVMYKGHIEVSGKPEEVAKSPLLNEVYFGI